MRHSPAAGLSPHPARAWLASHEQLAADAWSEYVHTYRPAERAHALSILAASAAAAAAAPTLPASAIAACASASQPPPADPSEEERTAQFAAAAWAEYLHTHRPAERAQALGSRAVSEAYAASEAAAIEAAKAFAEPACTTSG